MADKPLTSTRRAVTVNVTQPIIDRSERRNSDHCMIADAIRAALPDAKAVSVDLMTIRFTDPAKRQRYVYLTPRAIQLALIHFDQGDPAEPFTFQLKNPVQVVASGGKQTLPDGTKKNPSRKVQGVTKVSGGTARPTKLGGALPGRAELGSVPVTKATASAKMHAAAIERRVEEDSAPADTKSKRAIAAAKARGLRKTAPVARATAKAAAEKEAADRDAGKPASEAANLTLEQSNRRHVRQFGLKQLRA
jgi:hypothetical protein